MENILLWGFLFIMLCLLGGYIFFLVDIHLWEKGRYDDDE